MDGKDKRVVLAVYELNRHSSTDLVSVTVRDIANYSGMIEEDIRLRLPRLQGLIAPIDTSDGNYTLTGAGLSEGRVLEEREYREEQEKRSWRRTVVATISGAIVGALVSGVPAWIQVWLMCRAGFAN